MSRPESSPDASLPTEAVGFRIQNYKLTQWTDLFTHHQLHALTAFSDLIIEAHERVLQSAIAAGMPVGDRLEAGGADAEAYTDAVATYLTFALGKHADYSNSLTVWYPKEDRPMMLFVHQTIPMVWDFPEVNPLTHIGDAWSHCVKVMSEAFERLDANVPAIVEQRSATMLPKNVLISTDPPYYNNISYTNLSDFFYVWLHRSLSDIYSDLLSTMLIPKADELIADPFRHRGKANARDFFEHGFRQVFARTRETALTDFPITVYYAFKQSNKSNDGTVSTSWETLLDKMIDSN